MHKMPDPFAEKGEYKIEDYDSMRAAYRTKR
jgi:hypothetical protein